MSNSRMATTMRSPKLVELTYPDDDAEESQLLEKLGELYRRRETLEALIFMLERYRACGCGERPAGLAAVRAVGDFRKVTPISPRVDPLTT